MNFRTVCWQLRRLWFYRHFGGGGAKRGGGVDRRHCHQFQRPELLSCDSKVIAGMLFGKIKQAEAAGIHRNCSCKGF